ncbi:MAG: hypothetical protein KKH88_03740 [Nanoarchaeota archaeon]|nr:hypothetical protein [Nanoarchaeota archaeon]
MTIYRILSETSWGVNSHSEEFDHFVDAKDEGEAREKFQPRGTHTIINTITETPFEDVDDLKYYLVGLTPDWLDKNKKPSHSFLVKAKNGSDAAQMIRENEVGKYGTATKVNEVRYLGQLSPSNDDITQLF